jgi:hypothetical protein
MIVDTISAHSSDKNKGDMITEKVTVGQKSASKNALRQMSSGLAKKSTQVS